MSALMASIVDWGKLGEVIAYSLVVGVGVAACFSLAIVGATRFEDVRNDGGGPAALGYALLAALGLAATLAAVVIAIIVMTSKG